VETIRGRIKAISISDKKGTQKTNVGRARLECDFGIVGDAHASDWHRQVSLLGVESISKMVAKGADIRPGDFAENITTEGVDFSALALGTRLRLGPTVELELTQFGKKCHHRCQIYDQVGDCIMPREGVFAKVVGAGWLNVGDVVEICSA
jgi:MOSC domain-containing protein YiiM